LTTFCQLCGQRITGRGQLLRHPQWPPEMSLRVCQDCYHNKPRCRECGLPMAVTSPNGVCVTCSQSLRFCLACGRPVQKKYYEFDGVGPYCKDCYEHRQPCDVCGAPLTNEHWQLSDGRLVCAHCHASAIYSPESAVNLYEEMKKLVSDRLSLVLNIPTGLALVDRNQLRDIIRQQRLASQPAPPASFPATQTSPPASLSGRDGVNSPTPHEADADRILGLYARRGMRRGIYIQTGLPRMLFLQVAAHEYAHAWQGENTPMLREGVMHEGFAEWLAYQTIGYYDYKKGQQRMLERQDIYGQGLRWALQVEAAQGVSGLLEACRRAV
jgi:hypothetical protein